ncbi:MAG: AMP-binding protein, partial [Verrucomicrobiota bacterium]
LYNGPINSGSGEVRGEVPELALILHTSGSTAEPKIVPISHRQLSHSAANLSRSLDLTSKDRCLSVMPMFHIGALVDLLLGPLSVGGSVFITDDSSGSEFLDALKSFRPTWYQAVPTMLQEVLGSMTRAGIHNLDSDLRLIRSVSAPLPEALLLEAESRLNVPVIEIYGMTETAGVISSNGLNQSQRRIGSVGKACGIEIKILDTMGNSAPSMVKGEIVVRGPTVISEYEADSDINSAAFIGKWFRTGDIGYFDEEGFLFLDGRSKEMINRGGEKIAPSQIDECALRYTGIVDAAAFPLDHPTLGEEVGLAIVPDLKKTLDEDDFRQFLAVNLASFKVPRKIYRVESLPRRPGGKLERHRIKSIISQDFEKITHKKEILSAEEVQIAQVWSRILEVEVGREDNFFDLGGDSLSAVTLVNEIEREFGVKLKPAVIFDAPVFADFCAALSLVDQQKIEQRVEDSSIPADVIKQLQHFVDFWPGQRIGRNGLLVARNTLGTRPPLFWFCQASEEHYMMADLLGQEQPLYSMRTLFEIESRTEVMNQAMIQQYITDIISLQKDGPYVVGGFCEGARFALLAAREIKRLGHQILCLVLVDYYDSHSHIEFPIKYYFSKDWARENIPFTRMDAISEKSPWKLTNADLFDCAHIMFYRDPSYVRFLEKMVRDISESSFWVTDIQEPDYFPKESKSLEVQVSSVVPRFWTLQQHSLVEVCLHNQGADILLPTSQSGIYLTSRWLNSLGEYRGELGHRVDLTKALNPGEKEKLVFPITAPPKKCRRILEIGLLEEGLGWVEHDASSIATFKANVFKLGNIFSFLKARHSRI